jgi:D-3-phosphoglycerate dehydrogenase / 2-oxoglutarate reductase
MTDVTPQDPDDTSFPRNRIKVLLLENIHSSASEQIAAQGFCLETMKSALSDDELLVKIPQVHVLGIRSKTHVTARVLQEGKRLLAVGCFCIGTNQVDLDAANRCGVPVFNAPFSNTRSVAELVVAEVIALARQLFDRAREMHDGRWRKISTDSFEIRGKTLGIIGYGHIGTQVGILAEMLGMQVIFHDIVPRLPMGNNRPVGSLDELLKNADFVSLHVPATPQTRNMLAHSEIHSMKKGAYLLNLSRGSVIDITALSAALQSHHLAGAALDVFPDEPDSNTDQFVSAMQNRSNVILSPHVGGSTEEAQASIGREVTTALAKFVNSGATTGSVNFPRIEPPELKNRHRILNVHRNVPGVLSNINKIVSDVHANIESQTLATDPNIGYLVMDLNREVSDEVKTQVAKLETSIRTRVLY